MAIATDDRDYAATGNVGARSLTNADIRDAELQRARHALVYLKRKLGNAAMRHLLDDDLREMQTKVRGWVQASEGQWQTHTLQLVVAGITAKAFQGWYTELVTRKREAEFRAGHPEHFVSHPVDGRDVVEVIENIGETELPWRVFYHPLPEDFAFPMAWDHTYPVHYGMEILDTDGLRVGYSMRQSRDEPDGMHLLLTTHLPGAAPPDLVEKHINHFAIEFRNWTFAARLELQDNFSEGGDR